MLGQIDQQPYISPLQAKGAAVRSALDEALRMGAGSALGGSGAPPAPGASPPGPGSALPPAPPSSGAQPGGSILPQQHPSSPVMGALQQQQNQRPEMTPAKQFEVKRPAPPAAYAQAGGETGFARGGYVDGLAVRKGC